MEHHHCNLRISISDCYVSVLAVEIGRHFFPNCSLVLDKFLEDHMQEILMFNSPEKEQTKKKMPYLELKLEVMNASDEDKGESNWLSISTSISSCSSSTKASVDINVRKRKSTSSIDGQMSTTICQRFTQPMDFKETTNAMTGDISMSSMVLADDVVMRLLLLENRGKNSLSESVQFSAMVH